MSDIIERERDAWYRYRDYQTARCYIRDYNYGTVIRTRVIGPDENSIRLFAIYKQARNELFRERGKR